MQYLPFELRSLLSPLQRRSAAFLYVVHTTSATNVAISVVDLDIVG
jgi:hypothetical protein